MDHHVLPQPVQPNCWRLAPALKSLIRACAFVERRLGKTVWLGCNALFRQTICMSLAAFEEQVHQ